MSLSPASHCAICHSQHQTNHSRSSSRTVKPAHTLQSHSGVLLLLEFIFFFRHYLMQNYCGKNRCESRKDSTPLVGKIVKQISLVQSQQRSLYLVPEEELQ